MVSDIHESEAGLEVDDLWAQARQAMAVGNYGRVRELDERIVEIGGGNEIEKQAQEELLGFQIDPWVRYAVIVSAVLYGVAWLVGLFGR